jgi:hypothetical protein
MIVPVTAILATDQNILVSQMLGHCQINIETSTTITYKTMMESSLTKDYSRETTSIVMVVGQAQMV